MKLSSLLANYSGAGAHQEFRAFRSCVLYALMTDSVVLNFCKFQIGLGQMSEGSGLQTISCQMIGVFSHGVATVRIFWGYCQFSGETCCSDAFVGINLHKTVGVLRKLLFLQSFAFKHLSIWQNFRLCIFTCPSCFVKYDFRWYDWLRLLTRWENWAIVACFMIILIDFTFWRLKRAALLLIPN